MINQKKHFIVIDSLGNITNRRIGKLVATSDLVDALYVFFDKDQSTAETAYRVKARILRADGLVIGPVTLTLTQVSPEDSAEFGVDYLSCRKLEFDSKMLAVEGAIEITIIYDQVNELGKVISSDAQVKVVIPVHDAVPEIVTEEEYNTIKEEMLPRDLGDITVADDFKDEDHLVVAQGGATKKITGKKLKEEVIKNVVDETMIEESVVAQLNEKMATREEEYQNTLIEKETTYAPRLTNLEQNKADKIELQAVASGSPKGVFATIVDLQTAYPSGTTGIYLVTADGHWYYWDDVPGLWVDGGVYQAVEISPNSVDPIKTTFFNESRSFNRFNPEELVIGYYINPSSGSSSANAEYNHTGFIPVSQGEVITYIFNGTEFKTLGQIAAYDNEKKIISSAGASYVTSYTVPAGVHYIIISATAFYFNNTNNVMISTASEIIPFTPYKITYTLKNENIDNEYIHEVIDGKVNGLEVDISQCKFAELQNYYNKDASDIALSKYIYNGSLSSNAAYFTTGFIKVEPNTQYAFFAYKPYVYKARFVCEFNENKNFIGTTYEEVKSITTSNTTKYIRATFVIASLQTATIIKGSEANDYIPYGYLIPSSLIKKDSSKDISIFLPPEICIAVGRTIELYNNQVALCGNVNNFHFNWDCQIGKSMKRKFSVEGLANQLGEYPLLLTVYDNNRNVVAQASTTLKIVSNTIINSKSLLTIGDSLTNQKAWLNELRLLSNEQYNLVGTRGTSPLKHEGRSGFSANSYLTDTAYTYESEGIHPFWDGTRFNWSYYKTNTGINPDAVQIYLGTNGMAIDPTTNANNIKQIIDYIRQDDANIPIFVVFTLFRANQNGLGVQTSVDGYSANKGAWKFEEDAKVFNLMVRLYELLKDYTNLHFVPISLCHDSEFNFGNVETPVNPRAVQKEYLPVEATHPQNQGYMQMADIMYSVMAKYLNS